MNSISGWFTHLFSRDRRRAERHLSPALAAYYWTGAAPEKHNIRDISSTGVYLVTRERWYPGTVVIMTLQRTDVAEENPGRSISVRARAIRSGEDGVGLCFVPPSTRQAGDDPQWATGGADRRSLDKFLKGFKAGTGQAIVHFVGKPADGTDGGSGELGYQG